MGRALLTSPHAGTKLDMFGETNLAASRQVVGGGDDGVGVDHEVPVEIIDRAGLAEMFDAKRRGPVAHD